MGDSRIRSRGPLRYLILLYYNPYKMQAKVDAKSKRDEIERLKKKHLGIWREWRLECSL